jgi:pimeloyl-ACP methyl ester carboxylesterase
MTEIIASDGVSLSFDREGDGPPVVLIHGFAASRTITWRNTGWYETLVKAGRTVVAMDCRGHGASGKPHAVEAYAEQRMAADITDVMDALGFENADVMGYSMGGFLTVALLHAAPTRIRRAILAGVGENYFRFWETRSETIAEGLLAEDPASVTDPVAKEFRMFSEKAGNDLVALAACMRRPRRTLTPAELADIVHPVLIVCGEKDTTSRSPEPLRAAFAHAQSIVVPGRNHHSTVGDRVYKDAVRTFLSDT